MKKIAAVLSLFFSLSFLIFGQEETVAKVYETFTWEPVAKAKKYQVVIEKQNGSLWEPYGEEIVKETTLDYLFEPATYRIGVYSINAVGRKSTSTKWVKFIILDEQIPYLFNNYYGRNADWNTPVLYIPRTEDSPEPSGTIIRAEPDMPQNSIYLKGKNIFFETTKFYLVPIAKSGIGGKPYKTYNVTRNEVELEIIQRNRKQNYVVVTYDPQLLKSGYYKIEARNPGDHKSSYSILVLADGDLFFEPADFEYDEDYKINSVVVDSSKPFEIYATGRGFSNDTDFTINRINKNPKYPYTSPLQPIQLSFNVADSEAIGETDTVKIKLSIPASEVKPGYYKIQAKDKEQVQSFDILVKADFEPSNDSSIKSVKSKYNKKNNTLEITVKGKNVDDEKSVTLVSDYKSELNGNLVCTSKDKVTVKSAKKDKLVLSIPAESIPAGKYAIIIENEEEAVPAFIEINSHYKTKVVKIAPADAEAWAQAPKLSEVVDADANSKDKKQDDSVETSTDSTQTTGESLAQAGENKSESEGTDLFYHIDENYEEEEEEIKYTLKVSDYLTGFEEKVIEPLFFRYIHINGGMYGDGFDSGEMSIAVNAELELISLKHMFISTNFNLNSGFESPFYGAEIGLELNAYLRATWKYLDIYTGLGVGYNVLDFYTQKKYSEYNNLYFLWNTGFTLFQFLDFKYAVSLNDIIGQNYYFRDLYSVGMRVSLTQPKIVHQPKFQHILITGEPIDSTDQTVYEVIADKNNTTWNYNYSGRIAFDDNVVEVRNFSMINSLQEVTLGKHVKVVGENAFRSNANLSGINFNQCNELEEIGAAAFANDIRLSNITIPSSVVKIHETAFRNWNSGQKIILDWTADSEVQRDLAGLDATDAIVEYIDGTLYKPMSNPIMDAAYWDNSTSNYSNISFEHEDSYKNGILITSHPKKYFGTDLRWANVKSSEEFLSKIKNYPVLNIKGMLSDQSQNKKFKLVVGTGEGGYFEETFSLSKSKVKSVKINLSKLKPASYSKKNKYAASEIKTVQIVPDWESCADGSLTEAVIWDIWGSKK